MFTTRPNQHNDSLRLDISRRPKESPPSTPRTHVQSTALQPQLPGTKTRLDQARPQIITIKSWHCAFSRFDIQPDNQHEFNPPSPPTRNRKLAFTFTTSSQSVVGQHYLPIFSQDERNRNLTGENSTRPQSCLTSQFGIPAHEATARVRENGT